MNFLKRLGEIVLRFTEVAAGIAPLVQAAIPGQSGTIQVVSQDLAQIAQIVLQAEMMGQALSLPGAQKLQGAAPAVAQIIMQSSVLAGKKIGDPVLFQKAVSEIAGGVADLLSSLKPDVSTQNMT